MGSVGDLYFIQTASVRITKHLGRDMQLKMKNGWEVGDEELSPVLALIYTGVEVCLVYKGLIPKRFFQPARRRLHGKMVKGWGDTEVKLILNLAEVEKQTYKKVELHIPTVLYEAAIQDDVILSYSWCQL